MYEQSMKQLPLHEQPYEKFRKLGPASLSDEELLSIIIGSGSKGESALSLCRRILSLTESRDLEGLCRLKPAQLTSLKGIGPVKAMKLLCIGELSRRISKERAGRTLSFTDPESVAACYMEDLRHEDAENVLLLMLDNRSRLIAEEVISKGTVNMSAVSSREIFLTALRHGAVTIILLHNHPSGDPTPSREDIVLTRQVRQAGVLVGIELVDHIIIGDRCYFSFSNSDMM